MEKQLARIKEDLRKEIIAVHQSSLADAREKFQLALDDRKDFLEPECDFDLYETKIPKVMKFFKTGIQFLIGFFLIGTLASKGLYPPHE
ncbi:hypothetical protein, partial [Vibrio atlanticus]|uniref:hypothetical protein n=1 Tax=Vibrio atlanticus TaxID=693153 RepID=UPI00354F6153